MARSLPDRTITALEEAGAARFHELIASGMTEHAVLPQIDVEALTIAEAILVEDGIRLWKNRGIASDYVYRGAYNVFCSRKSG